jgi:putative addiction module CopG family antidote
MKLSLGLEAEKLIDERVRSGKYATAEDVVTAALHALEQDEHGADEFGPGEWDALLEEGEASGPALDGNAVLAELRALRCTRRRGNGK